jgi:type IV secretion system protein VirB10
MTQLPPEQPHGAHPEPAKRKERTESVLAAPRTPVTRWKTKMVALGVTALACVVGLAFYVSWEKAHAQPQRREDPQEKVDTQTASAEAVTGRRGADYQGVLNAGPGVASLPPAGTPMDPLGGAPTAVTPTAYDPAAASPPPPPQVDPRVQAAREQAMAARAASPFFGGAQPQAAQAGYAPGADFPVGMPVGAPGWQGPPGEVQPGNGQLAKQRFAENVRADDYVQNSLRAPLSPWEVKAGTIIPAALLTALNSDLPGDVIAQVTQPVYDHVTGRTVLVPQGSRLIGRYDSQVAYGQNRALVAWNRIIMPNGRSINIGSMTGADATGAVGLKDRTDQHTWQLARGILLSTVFSIGVAAAQDANERSSGAFIVNSGAAGIAQSAQQVGQQVTQRDLNRQPTLKVRVGFPVRVLVNKDMILAPYPK